MVTKRWGTAGHRLGAKFLVKNIVILRHFEKYVGGIRDEQSLGEPSSEKLQAG
jgi:hypothetical protein